ncbi:MAG: L-lactate dehydrogenase [Bacteroidetes bacterium]|nr:L-lactate dehydrogenase [Bacteroidota bacterium]
MKVGIVGAGLVGATAAYAIVMRKAASEVVLIDVNKKRADAEAADILHAVPFLNPVDVISGDYEDLRDCKVVVITAGVNQKQGESRIDLLGRNAAILKSIVPNIIKYAPKSILLMATNPVDILTQITADIADSYGIHNSKVIGSGTTLDTARFRSLLGTHLEIDSQHVHAFVIGEHGDSEVLTWSIADIGGIPLKEFARQRNILLDESIISSIDDKVRNAAYKIIEGKGATYYGIGSAISKLVEVITRDNKAILTVSSKTKNIEGIENVTISLPRIISGNGIVDTLKLELSEMEKAELYRSAKSLKEFYDSYKTTN